MLKGLRTLALKQVTSLTTTKMHISSSILSGSDFGTKHQFTVLAVPYWNN